MLSSRIPLAVEKSSFLLHLSDTNYSLLEIVGKHYITSKSPLTYYYFKTSLQHLLWIPHLPVDPLRILKSSKLT